MTLNDIGLELDTQGSSYWTVRIIGKTDLTDANGHNFFPGFCIDRDENWEFTYQGTRYRLTAAPWGADTIKVLKTGVNN